MDDILFEVTGAVARVTLNRPKALNALTLDMVRRLDASLIDWARDDRVEAVVIAGAGERAFCSGGDIRALYDSIRTPGDTYTAEFYRDEYTLNHRIFTYPKPYIALIDGVVMGGGVGVSVHGSQRVVSEHALFAMPETGIGLFPDVGGTYFLSRMPGEIGMYLGLTGARLEAADALYAGVGTDYVPRARLAGLIAALGETDYSGDARAAASATIARFTGDAGEAPLAAEREAIDRCFAGASVEEIIDALAGEGSDWAGKTRAALAAKSPTSLKVTFRQLRAGRDLDFAQAMRMEYRLSQRFCAGHDFAEGVRAVVIDKDNAPQWKPATLAEVSGAHVDAYFAPLAAGDLVF
ncbi:MAG: enoyl-CoA hydratase/isomerase family protein [Alphaproteobacteria bacterium]